MTVPYPAESRLLLAKRCLDLRTFGEACFMGCPLDEFTSAELVKIAQIAMSSDWTEYSTVVEKKNLNPFTKGDTAIVIDEDSIFRGKIIQVEAVVKRRVVATWESSRDLGSLYQVSFDYESLCRSQDDNDCVVKSEN